MASPVTELFELLRGQVSDDDVRAFVPNDPGAPAYYARWTEILATGELPTAPGDFDVEEAACLLRLSEPPAGMQARFLRFRLLTATVMSYVLLATDGLGRLTAEELLELLRKDAGALEDYHVSELVRGAVPRLEAYLGR